MCSCPVGQNHETDLIGLFFENFAGRRIEYPIQVIQVFDKVGQSEEPECGNEGDRVAGRDFCKIERSHLKLLAVVSLVAQNCAQKDFYFRFAVGQLTDPLREIFLTFRVSKAFSEDLGGFHVELRRGAVYHAQTGQQ